MTRLRRVCPVVCLVGKPHAGTCGEGVHTPAGVGRCLMDDSTRHHCYQCTVAPGHVPAYCITGHVPAYCVPGHDPAYCVSGHDPVYCVPGHDPVYCVPGPRKILNARCFLPSQNVPQIHFIVELWLASGAAWLFITVSPAQGPCR